MNILKKFSIVSTVTLVTLASTLQGALPPLYQSLHEYDALVENPDFAAFLGSSNTIKNIERSEDGFIVNSPKKSFEVVIVYDNSNKIGPADFHFKLPSPEQGLLEYKALLRSEDLKNHLTSGDYITNIARTEKGFVITTPKKTIEIGVLRDNPNDANSGFHFVFSPAEHQE